MRTGFAVPLEDETPVPRERQEAISEPPPVEPPQPAVAEPVEPQEG